MGIPLWRPKSPPASRKRHRDALRAGEAASRGLERHNAIRLRGPRRTQAYDNLHTLINNGSRILDPMDMISRLYSNTDLPSTNQSANREDTTSETPPETTANALNQGTSPEYLHHHSVWASMEAPEELTSMLIEGDLETARPYPSMPGRYAQLPIARLTGNNGRAIPHAPRSRRSQQRGGRPRLLPPNPLPMTLQNYTILPSSLRSQSRPQVHFTNPPVADSVELPQEEELFGVPANIAASIARRSPLSRARSVSELTVPHQTHQTAPILDEEIDHNLRLRDMDARDTSVANTVPPEIFPNEYSQHGNWVALAEARTRSRLLQLQQVEQEQTNRRRLTTEFGESEKPE